MKTVKKIFQDYQKTLQQIEKECEEEDYAKFAQNLSTVESQEDLVKMLNQLLGKKKAQIYGKRLYEQGKNQHIFLQRPQRNFILEQIEKEIDDDELCFQFKKRFQTVESEQQIIDLLTIYVGKKKAKYFGQKISEAKNGCKKKQEIKEKKQLQMKPKEKKQYQNDVLRQIEKELSKQDFARFFNMKQRFQSSKQPINFLYKLVGPKKAEDLGQRFYQQQIKKLKPEKIKETYKIQKGPQKYQKKEYEAEKKKIHESVLAQISKKIDNIKQFQHFKIKMNHFNLVEELAAQISKYVGTIQAEALAKRLFHQLGKDQIVIDKIQYLYRQLRLKKADDVIINKIMHLIEKGKKRAVQRTLVQTLGSVGGKQMFIKYQNDFQEKASNPFPESKFINMKEGLNIYEYKQTLREEQKALAKTLIVFGQTGCGKSTFLNAIVNYLAEVEMEDAFRYKIIIENQDNQKASLTTKITSYYIKNPRTNVVYRLIDTPGFGDTAGYEKDDLIVSKVKQTFKQQIDQIHCILFIMKASTTRVTAYQRYVFQSIMDLFNKDIAPNFVFIFTFSDSGKPQVLQSVQDSQYGFGKYWGLISQPKYLEVNSCGIFEKINVNDKIKLGYWEIGMMCMDNLFRKVHRIPPKSIQLSRDLMNKKETLANQMRVTQEKIQEAITKRQNLYRQVENVLLYQEEIDNNKDFQYYVDTTQWYTERTDHNVTRCNNCTDSNCHVDCRYGDGEDKINCIAFVNQKCTVCDGKCSYAVHTNAHIIRKTKTVKQKRQNKILKDKYLHSSQYLKTSQAMVVQLINNIQIQIQNVIQSTKIMVQLQQHLVENQMSQKKPQSTISYMEYLISNQNKTKKPGYQGRIKNMNDIINEMKFYETLTNKRQDQVAKLIKGHQILKMQQTIQKAKPGLKEKFFKFFS